MDCPKCGTRNVEGSGFCMKCGTELHHVGKETINWDEQPPRRSISQSNGKDKSINWVGLLIGIGGIVIFGLAAFFVIDMVIGSNPSSTAKEWFTYVNQLESLKADDLVCNAKKGEFRTLMTFGSAFLQLCNIALSECKIDVDVSKMHFDTINQSSNQATIHAWGELRGSVSGVLNSQSIDEYWNMVLVDGEWKWCGYANGAPSYGEQTFGSEVNIQPTPTAKPVFSILPYNLTSNKSDSPGWVDYHVGVAFKNISDQLQITTEIPLAGAYVLTEEGQQYDVTFESWLKTPYVDQWNRKVSINSGYSYIILPRGAILVGWGDNILEYGYPTTWRASFKVPEALHPKSIVIPGFDPIDISIVSSGGFDPFENIGGIASLPESISLNQIIDIKLDNVRIINKKQADDLYGKAYSELCMNAVLKNNDNTGDQKILIHLATEDEYGLVYKWYSSNDYLIGPGQTDAHDLCVRIPKPDKMLSNKYLINITFEGANDFIIRNYMYDSSGLVADIKQSSQAAINLRETAEAEKIVIEAGDTVTLSDGKYKVTVDRYEIYSRINTLRIYFNASGRSDLRKPDEGTYIDDGSDSFLPTDQIFSVYEAGRYEGWFEFSTDELQDKEGLVFVYGHFYEFPLPDISSYLS